MKNIGLLLLFSFLGTNLIAQITYVNADGPKSGQKYFTVSMRLKNTKQFDSLIRQGTNVSWNFTSLIRNMDTLKLNVFSMSGVPFPEKFPRGTITVGDNPKTDSVWNVYEKGSSGLFNLGVVDRDGPVVYAKGLLVNPYPLTFGTTFSDLDTITSITPDGQFDIIYSIVGGVDGWGDVITSTGTRMALRSSSQVKQEIYLDKVLIQEGTTLFRNWFVNGNGFSICEMNYPSIAGTGDTLITNTERIIGVGTQNLERPSIKVIPNPASDFVNIELEDRSYPYVEISLIDIQGKEIKKSKYSNSAVLTFDLSGIATGTYLLQCITSDKKTYFDKLIVK